MTRYAITFCVPEVAHAYKILYFQRFVNKLLRPQCCYELKSITNYVIGMASNGITLKLSFLKTCQLFQI
jgi:hypothetical protein